MASEIVKVAAHIREKVPQADYFHCMAHWLNLSAAHAVDVPAIRNALGLIQQIVAAFRSSSKNFSPQQLN